MKFAYSSMKRSCWQIHPISIYMGLNAASLSSFIHSTVCTVQKYILCTYLVNRSKILQVAGTWAECKTAGCCCCKKILYTFSHEYSALNRSRDLWLLDTHWWFCLEKCSLDFITFGCFDFREVIIKTSYLEIQCQCICSTDPRLFILFMYLRLYSIQFCLSKYCLHNWKAPIYSSPPCLRLYMSGEIV